MRQLVCLARAILLSSKILILDEATSSVDSQTDTIIQEAIRTHFADATVISIAHRINTIMDCDLIVVMDYGRVVEQGSVEQLTGDPNSYFAKLVQDSLHEKNTTDA
jgi:ABC-type multidrug transport system fused ATPase/permease subunit